MMTPSTKALLEYMRDTGDVQESELPTEPGDGQTVHGLSMQLKRKRYQMMLKQMLKDAGYSDLAGMTNIGRTSYEVGGDGEEF